VATSWLRPALFNTAGTIPLLGLIEVTCACKQYDITSVHKRHRNFLCICFGFNRQKRSMSPFTMVVYRGNFGWSCMKLSMQRCLTCKSGLRNKSRTSHHGRQYHDRVIFFFLLVFNDSVSLTHLSCLFAWLVQANTLRIITIINKVIYLINNTEI
jgi:hypothetical protein